jgi:hypothetical protein
MVKRRDLLKKTGIATLGTGFATSTASASKTDLDVGRAVETYADDALELVEREDPDAATALAAAIESLAELEDPTDSPAVHTQTITPATLPEEIHRDLRSQQKGQSGPTDVNLVAPGPVVFVEAETDGTEVQLVVEPARDRSYAVFRPGDSGESRPVFRDDDPLLTRSGEAESATAAGANASASSCGSTTGCVQNGDCSFGICGDLVRTNLCDIFGVCFPCSYEVVAECERVNCNGGSCS